MVNLRSACLVEGVFERKAERHLNLPRAARRLRGLARARGRLLGRLGNKWDTRRLPRTMNRLVKQGLANFPGSGDPSSNVFLRAFVGAARGLSVTPGRPCVS
jgi:hypothetical protein